MYIFTKFAALVFLQYLLNAISYRERLVIKFSTKKVLWYVPIFLLLFKLLKVRQHFELISIMTYTSFRQNVWETGISI